MDQMDQEKQPGDSPIPAELAGSQTSFFDDKQGAPAQGAKFVVFFSNEGLYALPSTDVAEVVQPLPVTPLPGAPDWLGGIADLRGEIIAVLNLKRLWNEQNTTSPDRAKLIVLKSAASETAFAIKVDKLGEIVTIPESDIHPEHTSGSPYVFAKVVRGPDTLHLLDTRRLVDSLTFN